MIVIKIFFGSPRSIEWYLDVLPDVPLTVFRMTDTLFQKLVQRRCHVRKLPECSFVTLKPDWYPQYSPPGGAGCRPP
jgi:hypothetical protein